MSSLSGEPNQFRVLHVVTHLGVGGAERIALDLIAANPEDAPAVFAVQGYADDAIAAAMLSELQRCSAAVFSGAAWPWKGGGWPWAAWRLGAAIRRFRPTVIHVHTEIPEATFAAGRALRWIRDAPVVVRTIHNARYWHVWPRIGRWCERRLEPSAIACVSADARAAFDDFHASAGAGPTLLPPRVIYNGVPVPLPCERLRAAPVRSVRLVFAGRFERQKGADLLPDIVRRTRLPDGLRGELTLFGAGPCRSQLAHFAASPPAGWVVSLRPPTPDLRTRLRDFDLVLVPSRFEGLGLIAIEALLAGVPVVATDAPGLREALPGSYPWRAAPGEAAGFAHQLGLALADRDRWAAVANAAGDFVRERFDPETMRSGYRALYAEAIAAARATAGGGTRRGFRG